MQAAWAGSSWCGWFDITRKQVCPVHFPSPTKTVHPDVLPSPCPRGLPTAQPLPHPPPIIQKGLAGAKEKGSVITVLCPTCEILKLIPKALSYQL